MLALDPIVPSTAGKVLPRFDFEEQITGVEVTVRVSERDVGTIARIGKDHELQGSFDGCRRFIVGFDGEETVRRPFERD